MNAVAASIVLLRALICAAGGLIGCAAGAALGLLVIPSFTHGWLFTTEPATIRGVSGPACIALGGWIGFVFGAMCRASREAKASWASMARARWSLVVGAVAAGVSLLLWVWPAVGAIQRVLAVWWPEPVPPFAALWLLLVNGVATAAISLWLGLAGGRRGPAPEPRRAAVAGCALAVAALAGITAWILNGGGFALVFG